MNELSAQTTLEATKPLDELADKATKPKKVIKKDTHWERDHKIVRGVFKNFELPGAPVTFSFSKYKGDPMMRYTLLDGETHELPYMIVKHINDNCRYPVNQYASDADGKPIHKVGKWIQRYGFYSTDFSDESPKPSLITVENM